MNTHLQLNFAPLLPHAWLLGLAALLLVLIGFAFYRRARGALWRLLTATLFLLLLAQPIKEEQQLQPLPDIALLVIDESLSQTLGERSQQMAAFLPKLQTALGNAPDLEWRELRVKGQDRTDVFGMVRQALNDIPSARRAGVIMLSDGQIHDAANAAKSWDPQLPLHLLLTGNSNEQDRRLAVISAPHYGVVGETVDVKLRIITSAADDRQALPITVKALNGDEQIIEAAPQQDVTLKLPLKHAGENAFIASIPSVANELTAVNNRAVLRIQGVREKLRVLLVSGDPHPVARTWRNLLRADPAVELVHFTILRPPYKQDMTPVQDLSLIPFPVQELFEEKLSGFDLVIFDRFRKQLMMPPSYFANIADYVKRGGALLEAGARDYDQPLSLYQTPLQTVLPTRPDGEAMTTEFIPSLTARGREHPVTRTLGDAKSWGPWYRQSPATLERGDVLLNGAEDLPLLILSEIEEGRVAQLTSDAMWLWARGHRGGGPATELLRRIAHWLMREPELAEDRLQTSVTAKGDDYELMITAPTATATAQDRQVQMALPDGTTQQIALTDQQGRLSAKLTLTQRGPVLLQWRGKEQLVLIGDPDAVELQEVMASDKPLLPLIEATRGGILPLSELSETINLRRTEKGDRQAGQNWLGLVQNHQSVTLSASAQPLVPAWLWLILLMGCTMLGWRREGQ
jgi:hypothetical protein